VNKKEEEAISLILDLFVPSNYEWVKDILLEGARKDRFISIKLRTVYSILRKAYHG